MGRRLQISDGELQREINSLMRPGDSYGNKQSLTTNAANDGQTLTPNDLSNLKNLGETAPIFARKSAKQHFAEFNDIQQKDWSNCNYLSALSTVAKNHPMSIRESIARDRHPDGTSTFTVTLYDKNSAGDLKPVTVKVDSSEVCWDSAKVTGDKKETWVPLIMTAIGKLNGTRNVKTGGGFVEAFETITGRSGQRFDLSTGSFSFEKLRADLRDGKNVVIGSKSNVKQVRENNFGIEPWHGYAVIGTFVNENKRAIVKLYDPAGQKIEVPFDKLDKYFHEIVVN